MRKIIVFSVLLLLMTLFLAEESFAQRGWRRWGGRRFGPGNQYGRMYNPSSVETISGRVVKVETFAPWRGPYYGLHIILKTETEEIPVHLGPGWFFENQNFKIKTNDMVEIRGSRIAFFGNPAIIAAEIKREGQRLKLRDESGFPLWGGWRRGRWRWRAIGWE